MSVVEYNGVVDSLHSRLLVRPFLCVSLLCDYTVSIYTHYSLFCLIIQTYLNIRNVF